MVADREGKTTPYALFHLQERGVLFLPPNTPVYEGMIIGEYSRDVDLDVNVCREKKLTNVRAVGHDEAVRLAPHHTMGLEESLAWIDDDELVEVTPAAIRLRKRTLRAVAAPPRATHWACSWTATGRWLNACIRSVRAGGRVKISTSFSSSLAIVVAESPSRPGREWEIREEPSC